MSQLEYSDYNSLVDVLEKSSADDTYQLLMNKEEKVLDTVNNVIKYYNDNEIKQGSFINMPLIYIVREFFHTWMEMGSEVISSNDVKRDIFKIVKKEGRVFYIGIMCILISLMMFIIYI